MPDTLTFSIQVPTGMKSIILLDFALYLGYQTNIPHDPMNPNGPTDPNPETEAQFAKRMIAEFIKNSVKSYRAELAAEIARKSKIEEVNGITIT